MAVATPPKPKKKLSAAQAMAWATAEVALAQARATVDQLKEKTDELRARHEHRLDPSDDPGDVGKDVKVGRAGGWLIRFTRFAGAARFSMKDYLAAGHPITPQMEQFITPGSPQVRVTVKRLKGPHKPGSVEPA